MAKTLSGVDARQGKTVAIGDNRYGMREAYDPEVRRETEQYYRDGDKLTVTEVKNPSTGKVRTIKK
jgi:hypothetical protein